MERLSNCVSTVIQLWKPINVRNPEDGDSTFSETSVQTGASSVKSSNEFHYKTISTEEPTCLSSPDHHHSRCRACLFSTFGKLEVSSNE
jgi:hypothetical protein